MRENFFKILELSVNENDESVILTAIKKKQAEWSKLRNHPSKGRIAQKNLSLLREIKKVMLDANLRQKEAELLLKKKEKNKELHKKDLLKQIELLSSKGKVYKSELTKLKEKFNTFKNIESLIKVDIIDDNISLSKKLPLQGAGGLDFLPTLERSITQKIRSSLKILNKRDIYHFLGLNPKVSLEELKKVTNLKYINNNKSAVKTAEVTSTSELLGIVKSIINDKERKKLYDNFVILNNLKTLDELIEISGKNGVIEKEEYLFIYEEGKLNGLDDEIIKRYIDFNAENMGIKVVKPDFSKPIKFRSNESNETQLFTLIRENEPRDIEELLNMSPNININKKNEHGSTPLILATYSGHLKTVKILIENGADVNITSDNKTSPLIWATVGEHTTIIRYLLNQNAEIDSKDKHGFTALMWAASKSNESLVKIFLQYDADTRLKNYVGETAFDLAKKAGNIRLFYIIKDHKGEDKKDLLKNILLAIDNNDLIFLSKQYGVKFSDMKDDKGNNILHLSIQKGKRDIINWILNNNKVDFNSVNNAGNTPIIEAVLNNDDVTVANLLKEKSLEINKQDANGYTPLIHAVSSGNEYLIKILLQKSAKMEIEDNNGNRALTIAVWQDKRNLVGLLINYGAKTDIKNKSGKTLMDLAKQKKSASMIDYLSVYIKGDNTVSPVRNADRGEAVPRPKASKDEAVPHPVDKKEKKEEKKSWWKFW